MYEFVDRPLARMNSNGVLLLQAMRLWVSHAAEGACCCTQLRDMFAAKGYGKGIPGFGIMMQALQRGARRNLSFLPPICSKIGEDEAVLLGLLTLPLRQQMVRHDAAQALVTGAYLQPFLQSTEALAAAFLQHGGLPALLESPAVPRAGG